MGHGLFAPGCCDCGANCVKAVVIRSDRPHRRAVCAEDIGRGNRARACLGKSDAGFLAVDGPSSAYLFKGSSARYESRSGRRKQNRSVPAD